MRVIISGTPGIGELDHPSHVDRSLNPCSRQVLAFVLHLGGFAELITFFILDKDREDLFVTHRYQTSYV